MGAGHAHPLYHHGHSRIHRLAPEVKVAAGFAFVVAVALTPRTALWAFAIDAVALIVLIAMAGLPVRFVLARLTIILPFVAFAFVIPFIAGGEQTQILGVTVSREGIWGMVNILTKASLGATVSILLAGTTEQSAILTGLERLHVPVAFTVIAAFMIRYVSLIADELGRMRTAMTARGYDPRWLWQTRPIANASGALFVRSFERGERVHAAMLSRGFTGTMPNLDTGRATAAEWAVAALVPLVALSTMAAALLVT